MHIKKIIPQITLFSLLFFLSGCDKDSNINDNNTIVGSGNIVTETREVSECNGISIKTIGSVYLSQGEEQSIRVEADDNIIDDVITRSENGILVVGLDEGSYSNITLKVYVTLNTINNISSNGAGNLSMVNSFDCNSLNCLINGAGTIILLGSTDYFNCIVNGAANIYAKEFLTKKCDVVVNGAGNCTVFVTDELDATVNGVGNINYYGNPPVVRTSISGLGHIINL